MIPKFVYIVRGESGEYADHTEWDVKAFLSREKAATLCNKLEALVEKIKSKHEYNIDDQLSSISAEVLGMSAAGQLLTKLDTQVFEITHDLEYMLVTVQRGD